MRAKQQYKIGWRSAAAIVIANMVGTGAFTTLGLQLNHLQHTGAIMAIWLVGGVLALCGALSYAELGSRLPASGGEYHYLSEVFHPFLGYLAGWVSLTVGFAAPIALSAMGMQAYLIAVWPEWANGSATIVIVLTSLLHSYHLRRSSGFQLSLTLMNVLLMLGFIGLGWWVADHIDPPAEAGQSSTVSWGSPAAAVALAYVVYAFSGWNAAAYIVGEIRKPQVNLPRGLLGGAVVVTLLYLALQLVFLRAVPMEQLRGKIEVGHVFAEHILGARGGQITSLFIALLLIAGISAMVWAGSRVLRAMARDYTLWRPLSRENRHGIPVRAIWFQALVSLLFVWTGSYEQVLLYCSFLLQLFSALAVLGMIRLRWRHPARAPYYRSPGFPLPQLIYLGFSGWFFWFLIKNRPWESAIGLLNLVIGGFTFLISRRIARHRIAKAKDNGKAPYELPQKARAATQREG